MDTLKIFFRNRQYRQLDLTMVQKCPIVLAKALSDLLPVRFHLIKFPPILALSCYWDLATFHFRDRQVVFGIQDSKGWAGRLDLVYFEFQVIDE